MWCHRSNPSSLVCLLFQCLQPGSLPRSVGPDCPVSLLSVHFHSICEPVFAGGLQVNLPHLPEGWLLQPVEGELGHHGASHPVRRHPVLCTRAVQKAAGRLLRFSGKVSVSLRCVEEERVSDMGTFRTLCSGRVLCGSQPESEQQEWRVEGV